MTVSIKVDEFSFERVSEIGKHRLFLEIASAGVGEQIGLPLLIANGARTGKTLVVFAGVHGDELEGIQAVHEVFNSLDPESLCGRFIAVPTANLPAVRAMQRNSPIDLLNLARVFPGNKHGSVTERIAFYLSTIILPQADFFIDLHSSGITSLMPLMVGYDAGETIAGTESKSAALKFGTPVMWGHAEIGQGRSITSAGEQGIPWLYVESPSGGKVSSDYLPFYSNGLFNLLKHLHIISGEIAESTPKYSLLGSGDTDSAQVVNTYGFFVSKVKLLDFVKRGTLIAEVRNVYGETIEQVVAKNAGCVSMLRAATVVEPGTLVCLVVEAEFVN
ncbi:MAG: succinylglutamate desuccinylase/aspartoacylase family protein [Pyrinomonadaceae bacterium]